MTELQNYPPTSGGSKIPTKSIKRFVAYLEIPFMVYVN
jgi:hypothetical protein